MVRSDFGTSIRLRVACVCRVRSDGVPSTAGSPDVTVDVTRSTTGAIELTETSSEQARRRIREIFDRVVADGLRSDMVAGASPEQLYEWAASQGVGTLPAAVEEVFGLLGVRQGPWWYGSTASVSRLDEELKELAQECLEPSANRLADAEKMLLLLAHGASEFDVVDGVDVELADPPVWRIVRGDPAYPRWNSVTAWFEAAADSVQAMRESVRRTANERDKGGHTLALQQFFR